MRALYRAPQRPLLAALAVAVLCMAFIVPLLTLQSAQAQVEHTVTSSANDGEGSLRQVVGDAAPGDTIIFDGDVETILLTEPIRINKNLTIDGPGAALLTIRGDGSSEVFGIANDGTVTIGGVTISGGNGGVGGGISNNGTVTITNSTISDNTAGIGGGISSNGTVTIINSTISDNTAGIGGGINNNGTVTIINSTISNNTKGIDGGIGGGINTNGTVTITNSTISNNTAEIGGGINNSDTLTITNSTISDNTAEIGGGINTNGPLTITNSTISGNTATSTDIVSYGGGIAITNPDATTTITSSTFASNTAEVGSALHVRDTSVTMQNSIVAGNESAATCVIDDSNPGSITSLGHNLSSDDSCFLTEETDRSGVDPGLASLANNGGPTETHAIEGTSPAYNAGGNASCPTDTDQRGVARPQFGACDIGAFELDDPPPPTLTLPDSITVVATSPDGANVDFADLVSGTDATGTDLIVTCEPASGGLFEIRTTTVECRTTDEVPQTTTGTFTVTVLGGDVLLAQLILDVRDSATPAFLKPRLLVFLNTANRALERGQTATACHTLAQFSSQVEPLSPRYIIPALADQLTNDAQEIRQILGC